MRDRSLPLAGYAREPVQLRLPVWACGTIILVVSAVSYWALFRLIGALGFW